MKFEKRVLVQGSTGTSAEPPVIHTELLIKGENTSQVADAMIELYAARRRAEAHCEVIVCAALRTEEGHIVPSVRHFDSITHNLAKHLDFKLTTAEQGFITSKYRFVTREEALEIAKENQQIVNHVGGSDIRLYSECLY